MMLPRGWGHFPENSAHFGASILFVSKMMGKLGDPISETGDTNWQPPLIESESGAILSSGRLFHDTNLNQNFCMSLVMSA